MGLSHSVSKINSDFCQKLNFFPLLCIYSLLLRGFPFNTGWPEETRMMDYLATVEV